MLIVAPETLHGYCYLSTIPREFINQCSIAFQKILIVAVVNVSVTVTFYGQLVLTVVFQRNNFTKKERIQYSPIELEKYLRNMHLVFFPLKISLYGCFKRIIRIIIKHVHSNYFFNEFPN